MTTSRPGSSTRTRIIPALVAGAAPHEVADARELTVTGQETVEHRERGGTEGGIGRLDKIHDRHPAKPFRWMKNADRIPDAVGRARDGPAD